MGRRPNFMDTYMSSSSFGVFCFSLAEDLESWPYSDLAFACSTILITIVYLLQPAGLVGASCLHRS
jgi:hypothetical protein